MHFFSPVERMNLVELVPHTGTSAQTVDRAAALARALGKTPVTVADRPGFFTSRVYARWLIEGVRLLLEGVPGADVESAAKAAGFPVGPLQAADEVAIGLVVKASLDQVAAPVMAGRIDVVAVKGALEKLIESGIEGRRAGCGFYAYQAGRRTGLNPDVARVLGLQPHPVDVAAVRDRLLLSFASESFLCWDDGTLRHPDDGDVASVVGIGFPRRLGGPFQWADQIGAAAVAGLSARLGPVAFPVGDTVAELARGGGRFADLPRREG
jgi:3-hydroxyacyl-CoA dehydrogenase/enoyl-CoA hydratase/3-hydroxybutyryl-CoA epimerase